MSSLFEFLGDILVRAKAKRDAQSNKVGADGDRITDGKWKNFYTCAFFRKELGNYYSYCAAKKKRLWTRSCNHQFAEIEKNIEQAERETVDYNSIGKISARLTYLKSKANAATPKEREEEAERTAQLNVLQNKANAEKQAKYNLCIDPLAKMGGIMQIYENIVSVKRARCLQRMAEYWGVVQQHHGTNSSLPPFRWSIELLSEYYNMYDPFDEIRDKIAKYKQIIG